MEPASSDDDMLKLRRYIATYPTDLRSRFELGAALCGRHDYKAAIPELQRAQYSPHVRWPAMKLLAEALEATGRPDVAARIRQQLSTETGGESDSGSAPIPV